MWPIIKLYYYSPWIAHVFNACTCCRDPWYVVHDTLSLSKIVKFNKNHRYHHSPNYWLLHLFPKRLYCVLVAYSTQTSTNSKILDTLKHKLPCSINILILLWGWLAIIPSWKHPIQRYQQRYFHWANYSHAAEACHNICYFKLTKDNTGAQIKFSLVYWLGGGFISKCHWVIFTIGVFIWHCYNYQT